MFVEALVCLAMNVYHEARGESYEGQMAVAQVTVNRVDDTRYPDNVCDVVYQDYQFSWTFDHITDDMKDAQARKMAFAVAARILDEGQRLESIGNATHYHATYVDPKWASHPRVEKYTQIGAHIFYYEHKGD